MPCTVIAEEGQPVIVGDVVSTVENQEINTVYYFNPRLTRGCYITLKKATDSVLLGNLFHILLMKKSRGFHLRWE